MSHTPPVDSKGAAIDELLIAFANDVVGLEEGKKFRIAAPRKAILALLAQEVKKARKEELVDLLNTRVFEPVITPQAIQDRIKDLERLG